MMKPDRRASVGAPNPDPKARKIDWTRAYNTRLQPLATSIPTLPSARVRLSALTNWLYALPVLKRDILEGKRPEAARIQKLFPRRNLTIQPGVK
jgi:hypothetical protein